MQIDKLLIVAVSVLASSAFANNWPTWRGPDGTGISAEKNLPLTWSTNENVRWRIDLPGPGNSSPIVWGNRVFITQAVNDGRRTLMCFDRKTGKQLWQSGVSYTDREPSQRANPYCSASPVTDGERVIASFGSAGLYCYDFNGKELWHRDFGKMNHMFGNAASPILYQGLCILNFGPDEKARLIAVSKITGQTAWEVEPPKIDPSEQQRMRGPGGGPGGGPGPDFEPPPEVVARFDKNGDGKLDDAEREAMRAEFRSRRGSGDGANADRAGAPGEGPGGDRPDRGDRPRRGPGGGGPGGRGGGPGGGASWSTPVLIKANGREELIMSWPYRLAGYDPKTGKQLWVSKGIGGNIYTSPVWGEDTLISMSSGPGGGGAVAVKPGGNGDVTESQRVWRVERFKSRVGSGVVHEGHFYSVTDSGVAECVDLKTGSTVWEERLKGSGRRDASWSSPLLADGKLYIPNQSGDVFVLRASPKFEVLATNVVGEPTNASLAASDGELFMRTDKALWCFASMKQ